MSKKILLLALTIFMVNFISAQTTAENFKEIIAEKTAQIGEKQAAADALLGEIAALKGEIDALPGWEKGISGTVGLNLSSYSGWFSAANPNAASTSLGIGLNGYLNYDEPKYFWRNTAGIVVGKQKVEEDADFSLSDLLTVADAFTLNSLGGYKLTDKIALSAMADYRTTILSNFNDPGYLDIGAGVTWLPIPKMVVVLHPLNYNVVFSSRDDAIFQSSAGCKVMVDYNDKILMDKISWRSNLTGFYSYKDANLSNYTWVNSLGFNAFKGVGVGFEFGIRGNAQEALGAYSDAEVAAGRLAVEDFDAAGFSNDIQTYWLLGLSFGF